MKKLKTNRKKLKGMTLLEVVIAIAVFASSIDQGFGETHSSKLTKPTSLPSANLPQAMQDLTLCSLRKCSTVSSFSLFISATKILLSSK